MPRELIWTPHMGQGPSHRPHGAAATLAETGAGSPGEQMSWAPWAAPRTFTDRRARGFWLVVAAVSPGDCTVERLEVLW